ncbi:MAG: TM1802 family CRISPR-associated protein [Candidatus Cloacimonetes bacterium]|nr:TM1802 family CRISPR-associated protein [Candidatus Cloacimonadota bacterium]
MIHIYANIGKILKDKVKYKQLPDMDRKRFLISQYCADLRSYGPRKDNDQVGRLINLNLDTQKGTCRFELGSQLDPEREMDFMVMQKMAPNDPLIFASHKAFKSILAFDLLGFIGKNRNMIAWTDPAKVDKCFAYLKHLQDTFYRNDTPGLRPKYELFPIDQQEGFPDPEINTTLAPLRNDPAKYKKKYPTEVTNYFEKVISKLPARKTAFALQIDGKFLQDTEYGVCYLDVLYYYLIDRIFTESRKRGVCHICSEEKHLAKDVNLKQKFYGVKNPLYFDGVNIANSSRGFSACHDCYTKITIGSTFAMRNLDSYFLGLNLMVLPEFSNVDTFHSEDIDPVRLRAILSLMKNLDYDLRKNNLSAIESLESRIKSFSLFLYDKPKPSSQQFPVYGLINSVWLKGLRKKTEQLGELVIEQELQKFMGKSSLSVESLRYLLYPSRDSHPALKQKDYKIIQKQLVQFLNTYLRDHKFNYKQLIQQFTDINARKIIHLAQDRSSYFIDIAPFLMNLYIKHLVYFNQIEGVHSMEEKQMATTLDHEEISKYFQLNDRIYGNNYLAQGLFIMGFYIGEIEKKNKQKKIKATIIKKLNLRGIPLQKVPAVMALVDNMRDIYNCYYHNDLDAYYRECMTEYSKATLLPEEVVFHIMAGRAYHRYLERQYWLTVEKLAEDTTEESNEIIENDTEDMED